MFPQARVVFLSLAEVVGHKVFNGVPLCFDSQVVAAFVRGQQATYAAVDGIDHHGGEVLFGETATQCYLHAPSVVVNGALRQCGAADVGIPSLIGGEPALQFAFQRLCCSAEGAAQQTNI